VSVTDRGVVVLTGPPCSGKSSAGRILAGLRSPDPRIYVSVDALFDQLLPDSDRNPHDRLLAYDAAHALARSVFDHGRTPILECTYARREQRAGVVNAFEDATLYVVELVISAEDALPRFLGRDQQTDLDERSLRAKVESFPYTPDALRLDPGTPDEHAHRIQAWLEEKPPSIDRDRWVANGLAWVQ